MRIKQIVWNVAIRKKPQGTILSDKETAFLAVPNPFGMWAADPFILEKDNKLYIFAELFSLAKWRGEIGYCVYENGKFSKWRILFADNSHYSYPNVFEKNGEIFMMPETGSKNEIALYRATQFPEKWEKTETVFSGHKMVDSVFLREDAVLSYEMFGNFKNHLVLLEKGDTGWSVTQELTDDKEAKRPGGNSFLYKDKMIRPAQDGSKLYGGALKFYGCDGVFQDLSKEDLVSELLPHEIKVNGLDEKFVGTHTYNASANYEVIDVQYYKFSVIGLVKRIIFKLKH